MPFLNPDELKNGFAIAARHAMYSLWLGSQVIQ